MAEKTANNYVIDLILYDRSIDLIDLIDRARASRSRIDPILPMRSIYVKLFGTHQIN